MCVVDKIQLAGSRVWTTASRLQTLDQAPDTIADTANSPDDADDVMLITKKREDVFRST